MVRVATLYWSLRFIGRYALLVATLYWSLRFIGRYALLVATLYWSLRLEQQSANNRHWVHIKIAA